MVVEPVKAERIRLVIDKAADTPLLRRMAAFFVKCEDHAALLTAQNSVSLVYDPVTDSWVSPGAVSYTHLDVYKRQPFIGGISSF